MDQDSNPISSKKHTALPQICPKGNSHEVRFSEECLIWDHLLTSNIYGYPNLDHKRRESLSIFKRLKWYKAKQLPKGTETVIFVSPFLEVDFKTKRLCSPLLCLFVFTSERCSESHLCHLMLTTGCKASSSASEPKLQRTRSKNKPVPKQNSKVVLRRMIQTKGWIVST